MRDLYEILQVHRRADPDVIRAAYDATLGSGYSSSARPGSAQAGGDLSHAGPPPGRPSGSVLDFGRYSGWSLGEIARHDLGYLRWLRRDVVSRRLRTEIETILREGPGSR